MLVQIFQVDAFTRRRFGGNPAAVMILESFLDDARLQDIAAENNLAETAFLVRDGADYRLRWFTPTVEVPLCGHATLASAAVVLERLEPGREVVTFHSASGPLVVSRSGYSYVMDFPARPMLTTSTPEALTAAIGQNPTETLVDQHNYLAVLETAEQVRKLAPDLGVVTLLGRAGLIVTAPGDDGYDCVSRYFAPAKGIPEDPVTGGAHCALTPYWASRLGKTSLRAFQASARGGELRCRAFGERVELEGSCVFYLEGQAEI
ncbi:PhzF family phenazine biosynthesis protein [Rhizobium lentis]|uniref:PhzF family phenazine biosynthesis protein n=1 Tax=Rhizobium lentis TaxID=1138194 RepID=A0A7W9CYN7_9HYPH|nr:PhzF family phenazine biosynthesis protein [Rhizobium lentis]MBB4577635.1 PhzF family phenazine biosynthesis protein [Rhizobium lentis]MBB5554113.1 PhzF family phenazine biosynthesis protein [Rhizobium lentis]MBB5564824.1 PhzF family phenazine biosynthesis protein [Rhizobium lentis]MBB5571344.1 PhzF family phenazine biosynthesis protein [Rhizobium lentis]